MDTEPGTGPNQKSPELIIVTKQDTHAALARFAEGFGMKDPSQTEQFDQIHTWLLSYLKDV